MLSRILLCLALVSTPAFAQSATGEDVIVTTDGSILRGHVSELRPGESAVIVLLDGRTRTLAWSEIARSEGPSFPSTAPPPEDDLDPLRPGSGRVPLVVESAGKEQDLSLVADGIKVNGFGLSISARICQTPCTLYLQPGVYTLLSEGRGLVSARTEVSVHSRGGHLRLKAISTRGRTIGIVLTSLGGAAILAGAATMMVIPDYQDVVRTDIAIGEQASFDPRPLYIGGGIAMGVGAAMIATGAVLIAKAKGGVEEEDSTATPRPTRSLQVDAGPMRGGGWMGATVRF
jgi:hypothetical protein